ncbi:periplasmic serine protease DO [Borreliella spielmanii A14S]|uniref:Periplasmic serine protease DO n=2 Tax=Borreliella spielmanii TaxID=88916 RepID=B9X8V2_9SPIR|nr:DegQ family serine endoprotease HtrA [Borreliella spielmanii]EEF84170.1 periplasmic serine protease DO [Borreliella spielmanii A14S]MBB6031751.1 Do/DeqQ family serine protease [Borreliella spielmanii]
MKVEKKFFSGFILSFLALGIGFFIGMHYLASNRSNIVFAEEKGSTVQTLQDSFREVSKKILPSSVEVHATGVIKQSFPIPFFFFDMPEFDSERKSNWAGSGVIIGRDSQKKSLFYVVTNSHVVDKATELEVVSYDKKKHKAKLIGKDEKKDIALISFESDDSTIKVADLGDSDKLEIGDWVMAVGSPFQFSFTVTAGIVSGLQRSANPNLQSRNLFIQTDAAINRGNSGGPLVNTKGEVIGINAWIASNSGGNIGLGFAIPVNNIKSTVDFFLKGKKIESAWLGISFYPLKTRDVEVLKSLGVQGDDVSSAIIASLYPGSPAIKSGLRAGDIIMKVNGVSMSVFQDVTSYISDFYAGEKISVEILRGNVKKNIEIVLAVRPKDKELSSSKMFPGFVVYPLVEDIKAQLNLRNWIKGVVVDYIDKNLASNIKMKSGDVILDVNSKSVSNLREFYDALEIGKNTYKILRGNDSFKITF